jgi:L-asparaginase/Glu-tRNA(Gln) amidotransferase subunit D
MGGVTDMRRFVLGAIDAERLINTAPSMKDIADTTGKQLVNIGSHDIKNDFWLERAPFAP